MASTRLLHRRHALTCATATLVALALVALAAPAAAQRQPGVQQPQAGPVLARVAPDLGLPALPRLGPDSRMDSLRDADRTLVSPSAAELAALSTQGTLEDAVLDKSFTGTGFDEHFQYQVPPLYDPDAAPVPLVIAYHGFGGSAKSVSLQTTLDEHCAYRGWFYLAPTGVDDKLFGTDVSDRNVDALVQWMLDNFAIDPDRIYMVGFSMGAGVAANYAARRQDPDGLRIAALGLVSGSYDWAVSYEMDPAVQPWMLNPFNFGDTPTNDPFIYRAEGAFVFDPATYPPTPSSPLLDVSLAANLVDVPVYVTWDVDDTITYLPTQSEQLVDFFKDSGARLKVRPVTGTVNPATGLPATHSWAVLDEVQLMHFLDGRRAARDRDDVDLLVVDDGAAAFTDVERTASDVFGRVVARADVGAKVLEVLEAEGLSAVNIDLADAGLGGVWPVTVLAENPGASTYELGLRDEAELPGYLVDLSTGELVSGAEWDPEDRLLSVPIEPGASRAFRAECPPWTTSLVMVPDPVALGAPLHIEVRAPAAPNGILWVVLSAEDLLFPLPDGPVLALSPAPPATLLPLGLDPSGELELHITFPTDPGLSGARLSFQGAVFLPGTGFVDTTNPFALDVQ